MQNQRKLIRKWRASADKAERHLGDPDMAIENEVHMRDMRMCADELEAVLGMFDSPCPLCEMENDE